MSSNPRGTPRRRRRIAAALAAAAAAAVAALPGTASAACYGPPINTDHSYGTMRMFMGTPYGAGANIKVDYAAVPSWQTYDFSLQDVWIINPGGDKWVEQGLIYGRGSNTFRWFWGHMGNSGVFEYHDNPAGNAAYPAASMGTYYQDIIEWQAGNNRWAFKVGPPGGATPYYGSTSTATFAPGPNNKLDTGMESCPSTQPPTVSGYSGSLRRQTSAGTWLNNWSGAFPTPDAPGQAAWLTQFIQMRGWQ